MTSANARALTCLIWAVGFVPAALVAMWLGLTDWSWRGFVTAYAIIAAIGIGYDFVQRRVELWLQRRRKPAAPSSSQR